MSAEDLSTVLALEAARSLEAEGLTSRGELARVAAVIGEVIAGRPENRPARRTFDASGRRRCKVTDERGSTYGPLRVVAWWGMQATNATWVCQCQHCGALCKRFGSHLRHGRRLFCPKCRATTKARRQQDLDPEVLLRFLQATGGEVVSA